MSDRNNGGRFGEPLHIERGARGPYIIGTVPRGRPNGEGLVELWVSGVGLEKLGIRSEDLARRIVACVNACDGMDDPAREIAALRLVAKRAAVVHADVAQSRFENADLNCPGGFGLIFLKTWEDLGASLAELNTARAGDQRVSPDEARGVR